MSRVERVQVLIEGKLRTRAKVTCDCGASFTILFDGRRCECGQKYNLMGQKLRGKKDE